MDGASLKRSLARIGVVVILCVGLMSASGTDAVVTVARAATHGCEGSGCNGLDPVGNCDGDAMTVATQAIVLSSGYSGQLDLRYSPSCKANWGRFTPANGWEVYRQLVVGTVIGGLYLPVGGMVTVWNPGGRSLGVAPSSSSTSTSAFSVWTLMVDGTLKACTGVNPIHGKSSQTGDLEYMGWIWGPCY